MSRPTLLVLAASRYQLDTILTAKRLGYRVVATDNAPANPGHALVDWSYNVDTTDREQVLEVARKEQINGVIAPCTDVAVPTAAYVAQALGLPGPPLSAVEVTCDKVAFRKFLATHRLPSPRAFPITAPVLPGEVAFDGRSWILKPARSSGSKGIFIVRSAAECARRLPDTLAFCPDGVAVVEEYIEGTQGTCEGILQHGEIVLSCVLDRQTVAPPYATTCGHHVPSRLSMPLQEKLLATLRTIWDSLDVVDGPFDSDFVSTEEDIYVLELTPRVGGNSISTLLKVAWGFDIVDYSVRYACGEPVPVPLATEGSSRPAAIVLLGTSGSGRLQYNEAEATFLRAQDWVRSLSFDVAIGQPVHPFINGRHRLGEAVVTGRDRDDLDAKVRELKERLCIRTL